MARICIIDDKEIVRDSLQATLVRDDHTVTGYEDPAAALEDIRRGGYDLVISDLKMPRMDGITFIRELRTSGCETPVLMMTAFATVATAVEAMKLGAFDYIQKPFEADVVLAAVERALEHARLKSENDVLRTAVSDLSGMRAAKTRLIGDSEGMSNLRRQLERVAASNATVLVTGESGTGKELAAWYIHGASPRASVPMLCVNCAALSSNLLESELFGHERGAFTGADRTRKGRFELADGGTLLLDEISEMALPLQAKLLRILQEGEFERVGSSTTRRVDVRVIATTNRDLSDWVAKKRFRADLFYRLNVLPVSIPPLRSRREDIPALAAHFIAEATTIEGREAPRVTPDAMAVLTGYDWPGNVRELENICHRAVTLCTGGTITDALIEPWLNPGAERATTGFAQLREGRMLEDMERQLIEQTLSRFNGHRAKSAKALGMGLRTLGMKIKQYREHDAMCAAQSRPTGELVTTGS